MKQYSSDNLTIYWNPDKCIHAGKCVLGLPQVFDRGKRPWINLHGATEVDIMKVIDQCPSGALSYRKEEQPGKKSAQIQVTKNGPLRVEGICRLIDRDGKDLAKKGPFALCRCGASKNKPFCDGSHQGISFDNSQ